MRLCATPLAFAPFSCSACCFSCSLPWPPLLRKPHRTIAVADTGNDLRASLAKTCHVALCGVLFNFNKSTLQPTSDAVLQQVANLLASDKTLKLEVQGHTDNVGNDVYNEKLSEDRAHAVVVWLTAHGASADRLTSRGYGKPCRSLTTARTQAVRRIAGSRSPIQDAVQGR